MKETTAGLLKRARNDFRSVKLLNDAGDYNNACMLSQQCIEKCLKALIDHKGKEVPMIHNINKLIIALETDSPVRVPNRLKRSANRITSAYMLARYTEDDMTKEEVEEFIRLADFTLSWVVAITK